MNYTCAECKVLSCRKPLHDNMPANCPMRVQPEVLQGAWKEYEREENKEFFRQSALLEAEAYGRYPRLKETIIFCQKMGYTHVGIAFCSAFEKEAAEVSRLIRAVGIEVDSVRCKCGGKNKREFEISQDHFVHPQNEFEPICNPIGQAKLLEACETQFNIVMGLCVGHDSLFLRNTHTFSTVMVVKDRVTGHNPVAAIYLHDHGYWGEMREVEDDKNGK